MSSPVVLGLRRSVAERLGWVGRPVTWAEIAAAAGARQFSYGMTDPSASNSGFSAVVAVATALVGAGSALTLEQAESTVPALRDFFAAQTLAAGSSGFLQDAYVRRATGVDPGEPVDGLINYESVLQEMNAAGTLPEPLELIRPADGVVTAEYPFTVLAAASPEARDAPRRLTEYLRTPDVQRAIAERTHRQPAVPGVLPAPVGTAVELPFPAQADVVDALLTSYFDKLRRPSRTIYVLDTSGSMAGDRIAAPERLADAAEIVRVELPECLGTYLGHAPSTPEGPAARELRVQLKLVVERADRLVTQVPDVHVRRAEDLTREMRRRHEGSP
jgi:Ca-activated chloride channel family protein